MARKKDSPQKAALRELMGNYLKENNVKVKDGTDVNSIMLYTVEPHIPCNDVFSKCWIVESNPVGA